MCVNGKESYVEQKAWEPEIHTTASDMTAITQICEILCWMHSFVGVGVGDLKSLAPGRF